MTAKRWRGRLLFIAVLALSTVAAEGTVASAVTPGIDGPVRVNGHNLKLFCRGAGSPTIVFEPGLGGGASEWKPILTRLASTHTRRCVYDRYGIGESDVPDTPVTRTIEEVATEKHDLLAAAGVKSPYILVSHSIGGLIDRYYAKAYKSEVAGVVLVDTAPDDWNRYTHHDTFNENSKVVLAIATASKSLRASDRLGKKPVAVVESEWTGPLASKKYWHKRQTALAKISRNSIFFVAKGTDHNVQLSGSALMIKTIKLVVSSVRTHKRLPSCKAAKLARTRC